MTKKLSELFELPEDSDISDTDLSEPIFEQAQEITETAYSNLEKIEAEVIAPDFEALDKHLGTLLIKGD